MNHMFVSVADEALAVVDGKVAEGSRKLVIVGVGTTVDERLETVVRVDGAELDQITEAGRGRFGVGVGRVDCLKRKGAVESGGTPAVVAHTGVVCRLHGGR